MRMSIYVIRRILIAPVVLVGVMTIVFTLTSFLPVTDKISTLASVGPNQKCPAIQPYCACTVFGSSQPGNCANPAYWRDYDKLGLNRPIPVQWAFYTYRAFTFQWGTVSNNSALVTDAEYGNFKDRPVTTMLGVLLPYTLELAMVSLLIILAVAIPLGNLAAVYRNRPVDQASRVMSFSGFALPSYLLGTLIVMGVTLALIGGHTLAVRTPWCPAPHPIITELQGSWPGQQWGCYTGKVLPSLHYPVWISQCGSLHNYPGLATCPTGFPTVDAVINGQYWLAFDSLLRLVLPALVIAFGAIAALLRFVRNSMLEVMNLDYIRTARAKGVPERTVVKRHAGRNSMNVTITVLGLTFAYFIGGFPVIESVFVLNGVGYGLALSIISPMDFGTVFGTTILFTYLVVAANIIVDVLYAYLDPRVRLG